MLCIERTCICCDTGVVGVAAPLLLLCLRVFIAFPLPLVTALPIPLLPTLPATLPGESMLIGVSALPGSISFLSGSKSSGGNGGGSIQVVARWSDLAVGMVS